MLPTGRITQRPPAYSAIKIGGKRAYALARAGETVEVPEREVEVTRFELLWRERRPRRVRDRVLVGHLRALADHGPRRRLLRRAAAHRDRRRSTSPTPTRSAWSALDDALSFLPVVELERRRGAPRPPTAWPSPAAPTGIVRLRDERRPDRPRRAARRRDPQARRRLPRLMRHHLAPRRDAASAPPGGGRVRRRARRPPRGDPRRRQRADVRAAPAHRGRARSRRRSC